MLLPLNRGDLFRYRLVKLYRCGSVWRVSAYPCLFVMGRAGGWRGMSGGSFLWLWWILGLLCHLIPWNHDRASGVSPFFSKLFS